jgi:hypothetical protein
MEMLFGLFVLVILIVGLMSRKREKTKWVREERYEESGDWIDKRPGERGTRGSLDKEREEERHGLTRQGRINDLALLLRTYVFEHYPGFSDLADDRIRLFHTFARSQAARMVAEMEQLRNGSLPEALAAHAPADPFTDALKKHIMDFAYRNFPQLLDLDLGTIRHFDRMAGGWAAETVERVRKLEGEDEPGL